MNRYDRNIRQLIGFLILVIIGLCLVMAKII